MCVSVKNNPLEPNQTNWDHSGPNQAKTGRLWSFLTNTWEAGRIGGHTKPAGRGYVGPNRG